MKLVGCTWYKCLKWNIGMAECAQTFLVCSMKSLSSLKKLSYYQLKLRDMSERFENNLLLR